MSFIFVFLGFINWTHAYSLTASVSEFIFKDITFLHKTFPVLPSIRAIIEVDVYVQKRVINQWRRYPILRIYTTQDHTNLIKQCTYIEHGQLGNNDLHFGITMNQYRSEPLRCELVIFNAFHCKGNVTIQDYIPRNFSFSLGFHCDRINSLRGLFYSIKIHGANQTNCLKLTQQNAKDCFPSLKCGAVSNLLGDWIKFPNLKRLAFGASIYQHAKKFLCYSFVSKCDPV